MNRAPFSYEDMIFENRNKSYGAYDLRVNYETNLMKSFLIGLGGLALLAFIIYQINHLDKPLPKKIAMKDVTDLSQTFTIIQAIQPPKIETWHKAIAPAIKPILDPLSYKVVSKVEPASVVTVAVQPPVEPVVGPSGGGGTGELPTTLGATAAIASLPEVMNSASVDKLPEFPGGMEGFYNFLAKNVRFPAEARQNGISAKLFVSFVINKEGKLVEIEFMRKAGYGMEESVMAVLEKSPKWTPGSVRDQHVNTKMILPVNFNLVQ